MSSATVRGLLLDRFATNNRAATDQPMAAFLGRYRGRAE